MGREKREATLRSFDIGHLEKNKRMSSFEESVPFKVGEPVKHATREVLYEQLRMAA